MAASLDFAKGVALAKDFIGVSVRGVSGKAYPLGPPSFTLEFTLKDFGPLAITRTTTRWRVNPATGLLQEVAAGIPAFSLSALGNDGVTRLLIEEARTNIAIHRHDLTNAAWVKTSCNAAKDQTGADGAANGASSLTATAGNATCLQSRTNANAARIFSAYVKRITGTGVIEMTVNNGTNWDAVTITGEYAQVFAPTRDVTNPTFGFRIVTSGDAIAVDFVDICSVTAGTNGPVDLPMDGADQANSVTRNADQVSVTPLGAWFNAAEGTLLGVAFTHHLNGVSDPVNRYLAAFSDGTTNEMIAIHRVASVTNMRTQVQDGGVTQAAMLEATGTPLVRVASVMAYKANDFGSSHNGSVENPDTSGTIPTVDRLIVGSIGSANAQFWTAGVERIGYWPCKFPDTVSQCLALT